MFSGAACSLVLGGVAHAQCADLLPQTVAAKPGTRSVTARDLIELRDIGPPDASVIGRSPLALSPDGRGIAFMLTRAETAQNVACRGMVVVSLATGGAHLVDVGGEQIFNSGPLRGLQTFDGAPKLVRPAWSPDGMWIAYVRRDHGVNQAWRARSDGSHAEQVTHSVADIESVGWSRDGRRLIYVSHPDQARLDDAFTREGEKGWLYDARIMPHISARPVMPGELPREVDAVTLADGTQTVASAGDVAALDTDLATDNALAPEANAGDGSRAWVGKVDTSFFSLQALKVEVTEKQSIPCELEVCRGKIVGTWWQQGAHDLLFLRREGWQYGSMGLYRWRPGHGAPRRIYATDDVLSGCIMAPSGLICAAESSKEPRHIVRLDVDTGRQTTIFEPNPEFGQVRLGTVQRLSLTNRYGLPSWGDLVLPPDYKPGVRLPLVVVQYHSDGFLRGGTGDEYPIFLFAAQGFAVLSLERPPFFATTIPGLTTADQIIAANQKDWSERRSILSSVKVGVEKLVAMGLVDPARMGITGLSDGATTARFAMINYPVFAAAAISTCCVEPRTTMTSGGIAWADWSHDVLGAPRTIEDSRAFWQPASVVLNASHINTPLLMQLSDTEHQLALEAFTALREAGKPVEMYIFPNEQHIKGEPVHRLNVYLRNLDWFSFWLQGREDPSPEKAEQYRRWEKMRALQVSYSATFEPNPMSVPMPQHPPVP